MSQPPPNRVPEELINGKSISIRDFFSRLKDGLYYLWDQTKDITESRISTVESDISTNTSDISTLQSDVSTLQTQSPTSEAEITLSGTDVDVTGIPNWASKIVLPLDQALNDTTGSWLVQIGDSGGFEVTGYDAGSSTVAGSTATLSSTAGFPIRSSSSSNEFNGDIELTRANQAGTKWSCKITLSHGNADAQVFSGGTKTLSAALTQVRLTTANGTTDFTNGTLGVWYV